MKQIRELLFWCYGLFVLAGVAGGIAVLRIGPSVSLAESNTVSGKAVHPLPETERSCEETDKPGAKEPCRIALTFDDGPHPVYTKELLDGLRERGITATFFVVGENIPGNESLIARMEEEGHLIGNHTYDHIRIDHLPMEQACEEVEKVSMLVEKITGHSTEFVRPPFGAWRKGMECGFSMIPVLWDIDPLDWTTANSSLVTERVIQEVKDQEIILLHDIYGSSVQAALQIADILKEEGYEFVTVEELILG